MKDLFLCNFNSDDCHTISVLSDSQSPARHDGRGRLDVLYNGRLLTCRLVGTYSLHHILNRSHYRPAPSSRRHHTHYSCIITQYTCLHRRQCVQSLQVPYQWFVLNLLVGEGNSEIFTFSFWLYLKIAGVLVGIFAANTLLRILAGHCYTRFHRCGFRPILATLILFALFSNFYHAYAAVAQKTSVIRSAPCLPYYFPLTATRLMMKLGVVSSKDVIK